MSPRHDRKIISVLFGAALAVGSWPWAAPAGADPTQVSTDPNPFGGLRCNCPEAAPVDGPALKEEIDRGLREGHTAWLPGLAPPAELSPGQ